MNPIMQMISGNDGQFAMLKSLMSGDPKKAYNSLMQTNPQFRNFVKENANKSPEQIAREHGIDYGRIKQLLG